MEGPEALKWKRKGLWSVFIQNLSSLVICLDFSYWFIFGGRVEVGRKWKESKGNKLFLFDPNKGRYFFEIRLYSHNNSCTRPTSQQASCEIRRGKKKTINICALRS